MLSHLLGSIKVVHCYYRMWRHPPFIYASLQDDWNREVVGSFEELLRYIIFGDSVLCGDEEVVGAEVVATIAFGAHIEKRRIIRAFAYHVEREVPKVGF